MFNKRRHKVLFAAILIMAVGFSITARAQKKASHADQCSKFDSYGAIGGENQSARLDNFAVQLEQAPGLIGYVFAYGPPGEGSGTGNFNLKIISNYLIDSRGIDSDRFKTIYGGRNSVLTEPKIELWFCQDGVPAPAPLQLKNDVDTFKGMFSEFEASDTVNTTSDSIDESGGPPVACAIHASFADLLTRQKQSNAYIVAFNGDDASPGAWRRVAGSELEMLKAAGADAGRLQIINGGVAKNTSIQLWVTSPGAPPPVKDAGVEAPLRKAVELGNFTDAELGDAKNEQALATRIGESLRAQPTLRACLLVRYGVSWEELAGETQTTTEATSSAVDDVPAESQTPEPAPAEVHALIERWRREFKAKYQVADERLVVWFTHSQEYVGVSVNVWLVPNDQPLPTLDDPE